MLRNTLFTKKEESRATRDGFGAGLLAAGKVHTHVVALCADLTDSVKMGAFRDAYPARFFEVGITEQSMSGVASGLASAGMRPFMASYAMFSPGRNWEQIRTTICYNDQPVVVVGAHAGLSVGPDGATHQALEDIALMNALPNMTVYSPIDAVEAEAITTYLAHTKKPAYIRLAREASPVILPDTYVFSPGKAYILWRPTRECHTQLGIIVHGPIAYETLIAARFLEKQRIGVTVVAMPTIKPMDERFLLQFAQTVKGIVTVEEHQIHGGLGSKVAQFLSWHHPTKVVPIAVLDCFGASGTRDELYAAYGLSSEYIIEALNSLV